jgi:sugar lactone lactonase YvrE
MREPKSEAFMKLASGTYLEGLAVDHRRDVIWYSDVIGGGIHGVTRDGAQLASFNLERLWTGGVLMNADGLVLSSGQGGIMWTDPESGRSGWLLDSIDGAPINGVNEMVPDGCGGIFFGTVDLEMVIAGQASRPTAIYRLSADCQITRLAADIGFTNGLMLDQARGRLYCNDTFSCTWAFDVSHSLELSHRQCFIAKDDADGMALDAEGNVWITGFRSADVARVAPDGAVLAPFAGPGGSITQVRFGGADRRDIYINAVPADGGDSLKDGKTPEGPNSHLWRGRSPVPGLLLAPAQFKLS